MGWRDETLEKEIVGKKVTGVYLDSDLLAFRTDAGVASFMVEGDCCSQSSFHDIIGVNKRIDFRFEITWM